MNQAVAQSRSRVTAVGAVGTLVEWIGMATVMVMMIHIILEVILRSFFNSPIPGTLEWVQYYYMLTASFVGMYLAQKRREHVSVTMITDQLGLRAKVIAIVTGNLLTMVVLVLFIWFGLLTAINQMNIGEIRGSGASLVVVWPSRFVVPVTLTLFLIALTVQTVQLLRKPTEELEEIEEAQQDAEL